MRAPFAQSRPTPFVGYTGPLDGSGPPLEGCPKLSVRTAPAIVHSMSVRPMWVRLLIASWALLQVAAAPATALVDALSASDRSVAVAHVEEHSSQYCQPPHSADCALCRYLSGNTATPRVAQAAGKIVRHESPAPGGVELDTGAAADELPLSRAPPVL